MLAKRGKSKKALKKRDFRQKSKISAVVIGGGKSKKVVRRANITNLLSKQPLDYEKKSYKREKKCYDRDKR